MTVRRSIAICVVMLVITPFLYFDGSLPFARISEWDNPARAIAAFTPLALAVVGSIINWFEQR